MTPNFIDTLSFTTRTLVANSQFRFWCAGNEIVEDEGGKSQSRIASAGTAGEPVITLWPARFFLTGNLRSGKMTNIRACREP